MFIYPKTKTYIPPKDNYISKENMDYIKFLKRHLKEKTGRGVINKALKHLPIPELHLSLPRNISSESIQNGSFNNSGKYSYCGPGTKVKKRLAEGYKGVNSLDEACRRHDLAYGKYQKTKDRNIADDILAHEASQIALDENKPNYERKDAKLVTGIMAMKSRFGMGKNLKKCPPKWALKN